VVGDVAGDTVGLREGDLDGLTASSVVHTPFPHDVPDQAQQFKTSHTSRLSADEHSKHIPK
jgi:hypothetical protein